VLDYEDEPGTETDPDNAKRRWGRCVRIGDFAEEGESMKKSALVVFERARATDMGGSRRSPILFLEATCLVGREEGAEALTLVISPNAV